MSHYKVILDEAKLDKFINFLPDLEESEVFYICLFGRHKYCAEFPNTRDSGQLVRIISRKEDIKEKLKRTECTVGGYSRNGIIAPQECISTYIGLNPRCLKKANQEILKDYANRFASNDINFNPISVCITQIHKSLGRKFFVDFDFDNVESKDYIDKIKNIIPENSFKILVTRGGFHLIVILDKVKHLKTDWHPKIHKLGHCDVRGTQNLTPIPGCTQGNFCPYFIAQSPQG